MTGSVPKFQAREGTLAYQTSAVTWDATTSGDQETFTGNVLSVKNVTVTPPKLEFNKIDCMGNLQQTIGANAETVGTATGLTPGYWQCQALIPTSVTETKVTGTLVLVGDEQFIDSLGLGTSQAITDTPAFTRYAVGDLTTGKAYAQTFIGSTRWYLNNGSEALNLLMTNAKVTIGEIKTTGADGHWEVDFECIGLAHNWAIEFKD